MKIDWNLDPRRITEVPIYQIHFSDQVLTDQLNTSQLRLLILSHEFAINGIPAFYLESAPSYSQYYSQDPVVIVFDLDNRFNDVKLQYWARVDSWLWDPQSYFSNGISNHFSRALTTVLYYKYIDLNPLYFTSFILIPNNERHLESFLVQPVPVLRNNHIQLRTVIQGGLSCVINPRNHLKNGSFILSPPYEHLLRVTSADHQTNSDFNSKFDASHQNHFISVLTVDKKVLKLEYGVDQIVHLTKPSLIMPKFFEDDNIQSVSETQNSYSPLKTENSYDENFNEDDPDPGSIDNTFDNYNFCNTLMKDEITNNNSKLCHFKNLALFQYSDQMIESFFNDKASPSKVETSFSVLEDTKPDASFIITEQIVNRKYRQKILQCIGEKGRFPSMRLDLKCIVANFLSYYRFDFGFSTINPPPFMKEFCLCETVSCEKLGVPDIIVNSNGSKTEVKADVALSLWEKESFLPIMGPKNAHYVVFASNSVHKNAVDTFMTQFCHCYSQCGFGTLRPYPREEYSLSIPTNSIPQAISKYFESQPLMEFRQFPVLTFIVAPPIFDPNFKPHTIVNYIRPTSVETATEVEVKSLAFVVYSRIRIFFPQPTGMSDFSQIEVIGSILFGFRYQPPFVLKRNTEYMSFHIAWDHHTRLSVWIDDIGTVLHTVRADSISQISDIINKSRQSLHDLNLRFTVTILGEGIYDPIFQDCNNFLSIDIELYSVFPTPEIKCRFEQDFPDDVIVFSNVEQVGEAATRYAIPVSTCFIMSRYHPSYKISAYRDSNDELLKNFAKEMSHLTWLSVKPGDENRTISYPPHICALLRKNECSCLTISRFEFLPSLEKI
ncbi:hypothetical protein TRFO_21024 [Tritrichomonas foetus]|uniref:Uncharacterized protein n=1 Tax=Tritrichomonas foetus TaxID=1144522 RepID=A0A1J4KG63_9EUKA|nr:hypothetical protein TRFO_21024 [Tritrichomonas foetus]|eukprot:OHT09936.1 hypothetical protein TRFO_21024 [Tritrichomonas foetus]